MRKKGKLKLDEILKMEMIPLYYNDAFVICKEETLRRELKMIIKETGLMPANKLKEFFITNESNIDIGKIVLLTIIRCQQYIEVINIQMKGNNYTKKDLLTLQNHINTLEKSIKDLKKYYRNMDEEYISYLDYNEENNDYDVIVYNSNEIVRDKNKNPKRFKSIYDKYFKENGVENIFSLLSLVDVLRIFFDKELGTSILISIESKIANKIGGINFEKSSKTQEIHETFKKVLEGNENNPQIDEVVNEELSKYIKYIDTDKFLLIVAYRIRQQLENGRFLENSKMFEKLLKSISNSINQQTNIFYVSEIDDDNINEEERKETVEYSYKELKSDLEKFVNGEYWSKDRLNEEKSKILEKTANLNEYTPEMIKIMNIPEHEIEEIMGYNIDNFVYGVEILNYDIEKIKNSLLKNSEIPKEEAIIKLYNNNNITIQNIILLYKNGVIDSEKLSDISEEIDFSKEINLEGIKENYFELKQTKGNSEKEDVLINKIELYKITYLDKKTSEEKKKIADEMMYDIYDNENAMMYFFDNGLIPLEVLADWTGEDFVEKLYNKKSIDLEKIETLYNNEKVSEKFLEKKILESDLAEEELINYISKGYISEKNIIKIFEDNAIYRAEADKLFENGIISEQTYEIIKNRDLKVLADNAGNPLEGGIKETEEYDDIIEIPRENSKKRKIKREYENDEYVDIEISLPNTTSKAEIRGKKREKGKGSTGGGNSKKLINPLVRDEFLRALKRKLPREVNYDGMGKNNPFYNYNFFIIKTNNAEKEIKRDDIIIAERFYVDRETKDEFAMDNATYVMRYEDYLILQGKQKENEIRHKREAIKEVEGAIYVVNHRSGTWAKNLLKAITQARYGKSFKSVSDRNTREKMMEWLGETYIDEEFLEIMDLATRMDRDEEFTYVEKNGKFVKINNLGTNSDDTESR